MPLWIELVGRVREAYRAAKDDRAALDFDDLETLTRDLLQDDGVRARYLGAEFRHVLVDEFQDTNAAQWAIINRIADPARAGLPVRRRRPQAEHLRLSRRGRERVRAACATSSRRQRRRSRWRLRSGRISGWSPA